MLSDELIQSFRRDGAVCVRGAFSADEVAMLEQGIERNLADPSERAIVASRDDDAGRFVEDFCNWGRIPEFERLIRESDAAAIAGELMGSERVRLYHDHMLVKEAGTRQPTPWHQDQPYYNISGSQNCSFWIPVDPVSRASTLEFVAGSHRGPWLMPRSFMDAQAKWFPEGSLADLPDVEARRDAHRIVGWELAPGDAVCFHMLTLHASGGVAAGQRRRVFSVRLIGDDIRHAPRRWQTSPDFPGLADSLAPGAPLEHALFPPLWP